MEKKKVCPYNYECVREKVICDHIVSDNEDTLRCDLEGEEEETENE